MDASESDDAVGNRRSATREPTDVEDIRRIAKDVTIPNVWFFISGYTEDNKTKKANRKSLERYTFRPRWFRFVPTLHTRTTILGHPIDVPIGIGPSALHKMVHSNGEMATARAAEAMNTCYITSMYSSISISEITSAAPTGLKWLQLCPLRYDWMMKEMVATATEAGYKAIVLTIDQGKSNKNRSLYSSDIIKTCMGHFTLKYVPQPEGKPDLSLPRIDSWTWNDLKKFRMSLNVPLVVKGVLTAEDAERAIECGVEGIIVSNHGGRHFDDLPAAIDVLPEIVRSVKDRCEVYMDGGIRTGNDVIKAIALGARAVFIGQSTMWGLAYNGEQGVKKVLSIMQDEMTSLMGMLGTESVKDIVPEMLCLQNPQFNIPQARM